MARCVGCRPGAGAKTAVPDAAPAHRQTLPPSAVVLQVLAERVALETRMLRHLVVLIPDTELPHRGTHRQ